MTRFNARWRPLILAALAVAVGVTFVVSRAGTATAAAPRLTAIEIVDGVLFNDGVAAQYLTELRRGKTEWNDELRRVQRLIHDSVSADPRWASSFAQRMQSGDPRKVARAMSELGVIARQVLDKLYGPDKVDEAILDIDKKWAEEQLTKASIAHTEFSLDSGSDTWFEVDTWAVAVAVVAAALVLVVALIDFTPKDFSERADLAHEVLLNDVAAGLAMKA